MKKVIFGLIAVIFSVCAIQAEVYDEQATYTTYYDEFGNIVEVDSDVIETTIEPTTNARIGSVRQPTTPTASARSATTAGGVRAISTTSARSGMPTFGGRATTDRTISARSATPTTSARSATISTGSRATSARSATTTTTRNVTTTDRAVSARSAMPTTSARSATPVSSGRATSARSAVPTTSARSATTASAPAVTYSTTDTAAVMGEINNAATARAAVVSPTSVPVTDTNAARVGMVAVGSSGGASRAGITTPITTTQSVATTVAAVDTSIVYDNCKKQYFDCMDQFCNVLDQNQGRCSCSPRIVELGGQEKTLKSAGDDLNKVAQNIRLVGYSKDEIRALFTATEGELALSATPDTSETKKFLDQLEEMILNPASTAATNSSSSLTFETVDLSTAVSGLNSWMATSAKSFSNSRGEELFKNAQNRCQSILTNCAAENVDAVAITGTYDLEMDKACIAYERGLSNMTAALNKNIMTAENLLRQARLDVYNNQNKFDLRGCLSELETCMTDDLVCGKGYSKCLDVTGQYVDSSGRAISGRDITSIKNQISMADIASDKIDAYIKGSSQTVTFLKNKIGTGDDGMCRRVMDRCRAVSYKNNAYDQNNEVVMSFFRRALPTIKASQEELIASNRTSCLGTLYTCYENQKNAVSSVSENVSLTTVTNILTNVCRPQALACAKAVFDNNKTSTGCPADGDTACISNISKMFFENMYVPDAYLPTLKNSVNSAMSKYKATDLGSSKVSSNYGIKDVWGNDMTLSTGGCIDLIISNLSKTDCGAVVNNISSTCSGYKTTANNTAALAGSGQGVCVDSDNNSVTIFGAK